MKTSSNATRKAEIVASRGGSREVRITITDGAPNGPRASSRALDAEAFRLAAEVELATPTVERWIVRVERAFARSSAVVIELAKGTADEAARALSVAFAALEVELCSAAPLHERTASRLA
jgi:hypothetical protein